MGMSYKFQRLREKIRQAVASGELSGKLPGERELARRFHVNAKTLSKALTDLAAEGLLQRSIGRGTFVRGAADEEPVAAGPWLLISDRQSDPEVIAQLRAINSEAQVIEDVSALRPSYLNQFAAVIDLAAQTPESFLRDLLVRNVQVVALGREPRTYSTNAVLIDSALGAAHLARQMLLTGHRRFAAIEGRTQTIVADTIRSLAPNYNAEISVDACFPRDIVAAVESGVTACICDNPAAAEECMRLLAQADVAVPGKISIAAIGSTPSKEYPCTGYYVGADQKATAVAEILRAGQNGRPTILWLTGKVVDRATIAPPGEEIENPQPSQIPRITLSA